MNTNDFTTAARERAWPAGSEYAGDGVGGRTDLSDAYTDGFEAGAEWARSYLTAQEPTDAAQIIDQHRIEKRWVGDGVRIECHCGHESSAVWDPAAGPIDEENNTHRVADRLHSVHVADVLARAARRDDPGTP